MALSAHDIAKIRSLQLRTKRLLHTVVSGTHRTIKRGYGLEFDQLRDYEQGDDVRFIDWNSSARAGRLMVKQFFHEHTPTILIALDISGSTLFGSTSLTTATILKDLALILLYAASHWKASLGLILFDEEIVEAYMPRLGEKVVHQLTEKVMRVQSRAKRTSMRTLLKFINQQQRKNSLVFILSDCIDDQYEAELACAAFRHELVMVRPLDQALVQLPDVGYVYVQDSETRERVLVSSREVSRVLTRRIAQQNELFKRCNVDCIDIRPEHDLVESIGQFFLKNIKYGT